MHQLKLGLLFYQLNMKIVAKSIFGNFIGDSNPLITHHHFNVTSNWKSALKSLKV